MPVIKAQGRQLLTGGAGGGCPRGHTKATHRQEKDGVLKKVNKFVDGI
jgi:hypothetical protein